jgi:DNA-binding HxlR family transcriptional regulator
MKDVEVMRDLFHRRWAMPVLALLYQRNGDKFVTLYRSLDASQGGMRETLDELTKRGWVMENPGYGHPMRPEYVLTDQGREIGEACFDLWFALGGYDWEDVAKSKWAMPVVYVLGSGPLRFSELSAQMAGVTDRALVSCLKALTRAGVAIRTVEATYPPSVTYRLTGNGIGLFDPLSELAARLAAQ